MNIRRFSLQMLAFAAAFMIVMTGCEEDPIVDPVGPAMSAISGGVLDTATVNIDSTFLVKLDASAGDGDLTRLEIKENGTLLSNLDRIFVNGTLAGGNPVVIPDASKGGFTWDIGIVASSVSGETNTYSFTVVDANGKSESVEVSITTVDPRVPVQVRTAILLLNAGGPAGTGGLDLHSGNGTGSFSDSTDLRDMGIDLSQPNATNWIQKITTNGLPTGAILKVPAASFDYSDINFQDQIVAGYDAGTTVTGTSDKVEVGDVFFVYSTDSKSEYAYFLLKVTKVEVTTTNNADYYEFEVKR
ncbi:MAG: hypothetical protein OHK0039_36650 [Bacteroidia bacterium]